MAIFSRYPASYGSNLKSVYPDVISVSRASDIPAFHSKWFMERLRQEYCVWQNPFNANQRQIVSFKNAKLFVFWSKNPAPLLPYLHEISDSGKKFYFQFTINNYEKEELEPGLPALAARIKTFSSLAKEYKVIWRYDPVILSDCLPVKWHIQQLKFLMEEIGWLAEKLVFSFVDLYGRVETKLKKFNPCLRAPEIEEMREFSMELMQLRDKIAPGLQLASCAESGIDFAEFGIAKNSCIDPVMINKICQQEVYKELPKKQSEEAYSCSLFKEQAKNIFPERHFEKDKGQRKECNCAPSKDIGSYRHHGCLHHCVYCYAGHAQKV